MDPKSSYYNSIFWIEVDRIRPNPLQPRKEFDELALKSLAESIRQYGVLQPLTVTKIEKEEPGEGIKVEYELIAGERRLRASKLAGVQQVPCLIRQGEDSDRTKLEMAIIENLQREDLNPVDRAKAFKQLIDQFGLKHADVGRKIGKSREFVSNSVRILNLPQEMMDALSQGEIVEGHTRPLLMLADRPKEQETLFREIMAKRLNVRDSEQIARRVALERTRKMDLTPELMQMEKELSEKFGTRVRIEKGNNGGKVLIDFFSVEDLAHIRDVVAKIGGETAAAAQPVELVAPTVEKELTTPPQAIELPADATPEMLPQAEAPNIEEKRMESPPPAPEPEPDLYSIKNFTV